MRQWSWRRSLRWWCSTQCEASNFHWKSEIKKIKTNFARGRDAILTPNLRKCSTNWRINWEFVRRNQCTAWNLYRNSFSRRCSWRSICSRWNTGKWTETRIRTTNETWMDAVFVLTLDDALPVWQWWTYSMVSTFRFRAATEWKKSIWIDRAAD